MASFALLDTMTFSYLQGLGQYGILRQLAAATGRLAVSQAVLRQVHRSGALGSTTQSLCDRHELHLLTSRQGDEVANRVRDTLGDKAASGLVRRDRVDVEVVEFARAGGGVVISCETGIRRLAERRSVETVDIADLLFCAVRLGFLSEDAAEKLVAAKWRGASAAGTGAPRDLATTLRETIVKRARPAWNSLCAVEPASGPIPFCSKCASTPTRG